MVCYCTASLFCKKTKTGAAHCGHAHSFNYCFFRYCFLQHVRKIRQTFDLLLADHFFVFMVPKFTCLFNQIFMDSIINLNI